LAGRKSDLRKVFTEHRRTEGRTDRQTDGRRTPRDSISSWNKLNVVFSIKTCGRVRARPSFQLGTLSTRIANLLGAFDFRDSTKVPVSRDV